MKITSITRIAAILLLGRMILLIIFTNLPFPLSSFSFYFFLFIAILAAGKPGILFYKINKYVIFFLFYFLLLFLLDIYDAHHNTYNLTWFINREILPLFVSTTLFGYFIKFNDSKDSLTVIRIVCLFCAITALTSVLGLLQYPLAARQLAGALQAQGEIQLIDLYQRHGIAGYDFYYGIAFAVPSFIMLLKKHLNFKRHWIMILIFISIMIFSIILSQLTAAFLFSAIGIIFSMISAKSYKKSLRIFASVLIIILVVPNHFFADVVGKLAIITPSNSTIQDRLNDLRLSIELSHEGLLEQETHIGMRARRIPQLLDNFIDHPISGSGKASAHNFWLDRLSFFGLLGIIPWIILFYGIISYTIQYISHQYRYYYFLSIGLFFSCGFLKGGGGRLWYLGILFLVPSILIIYSNNKTLFMKTKER